LFEYRLPQLVVNLAVQRVRGLPIDSQSR
jgi:hypothetical protein